MPGLGQIGSENLSSGHGSCVPLHSGPTPFTQHLPWGNLSFHLPGLPSFSYPHPQRLCRACSEYAIFCFHLVASLELGLSQVCKSA